jgi:hypothetical protein
VAIQVEVLKLGTGIGRSINLATQLQSRNELLTARDAALGSDQRIMREAAKLGMYMPGPTETGFMAAGGRGAMRRAIQGIRTPDAQAFLAALAAQVSLDGTANPTLGSSGSPVPPGSPAATPVTPGAPAVSTGTPATTGTAAGTGNTTGAGAAQVPPTTTPGTTSSTTGGAAAG